MLTSPHDCKDAAHRARFTGGDRHECFDHGARIGAVMALTLKAIETEFGSPADVGQIEHIREQLDEALHDYLVGSVSEFFFEEIELGICKGCPEYAELKVRRAA